MMAYSVSGTLSPDCSTTNTGEPAGVHDGRSYWTWASGGRTWFLYSVSGYWLIGETLGSIVAPYWVTVALGVTPIGLTFAAVNPYPEQYTGIPVVGTAITTTYATLTINDGPLAGQYIVLKTG